MTLTLLILCLAAGCSLGSIVISLHFGQQRREARSLIVVSGGLVVLAMALMIIAGELPSRLG